MDPISIDDFRKVDLAVGKVVAIENHPGADKLYLVKVDLGTETRQLVAGLRPYYQPEQLLGKLVVVVANLAPATIRGQESNGMLLAAGDGTNVIVLTPEREIAPGSRIR